MGTSSVCVATHTRITGSKQHWVALADIERHTSFTGNEGRDCWGHCFHFPALPLHCWIQKLGRRQRILGRSTLTTILHTSIHIVARPHGAFLSHLLHTTYNIQHS